MKEKTTGANLMWNSDVMLSLLFSIWKQKKRQGVDVTMADHFSFVPRQSRDSDLCSPVHIGNFLNSVVAASRTFLMTEKKYAAQIVIVHTGSASSGHWQTLVTFRCPEDDPEEMRTLVFDSLDRVFYVDPVLAPTVLFTKSGIYSQNDDHSCGVFAFEAARHFTYNRENVRKALELVNDDRLGVKGIVLLAPGLDRIIHSHPDNLQATITDIRDKHEEFAKKHEAPVYWALTRQEFYCSISDVYGALEAEDTVPPQESLKKLYLKRKAYRASLPLSGVMLCLSIVALIVSIESTINTYNKGQTRSFAILTTCCVVTAVTVVASLGLLIYASVKPGTKLTSEKREEVVPQEIELQDIGPLQKEKVSNLSQ